MTSTSTPLHTFISNVIGGSIITQFVEHTVETNDPDEVTVTEAYQFVTERLGLDFEKTASTVLLSVLNTFCEPEGKKYFVEYIATLLWQKLGDPQRNGAKPPPIYNEAGIAIHAWLSLLLYPTYHTP